MTGAATRRHQPRTGALLVTLALLVCGCSAPADGSTAGTTAAAADGARTARPLTTDEAQGLATMRFRTSTPSVRHMSLEVDDHGQRFVVDGWVDLIAHVGYATVRDAATPDVALLAWTPVGIATYEPAPAGTASLPPLPPPGLADAAAWRSSSLDPSTSRLHAVLATVLALGNDRPDNPLLLQQSDARWLREDEVGGTAVVVYSAPTTDELDAQDTTSDGSAASVRYWVDSGWVAQRLEVRPGGSGPWVQVDLAPADDVELSALLLDPSDAGPGEAGP